MKKALVLLFFIVTSVSAQNHTEITEKNLVGKWLFKDIVEESGKDNGIPLKERKELLEGVYLLLREDGTCMMSFIVDREGTWSLAGNIISMKTTKTDTWTIHSFTGKEIVLSRNDAKQKILFAKQ
jgi:hypothetical protein